MKILMMSVFVFVVSVTHAFAQDGCVERGIAVERLKDNFGEVRQTIGLDLSGDMVEMYASPDTGTWTVLLTNPDGISCVVMAGTDFYRDNLQKTGMKL